jgi:hypothetical protein
MVMAPVEFCVSGFVSGGLLSFCLFAEAVESGIIPCVAWLFLSVPE